jgi:hypothetical protein
LKTIYVVSGLGLIIVGIVPAIYAGWLWVIYNAIGWYPLVVWEEVIALCSASAVLLAAGARLLWKGRNDWLD